MPAFADLDELTGTPHAEVFPDRPRTVRLELDAGERVPAHSHPGIDVLVHVLSGRVALDLDDETHDLAAGELARFSGEREVSPRAVDPSTALVVLAPAEADE